MTRPALLLILGVLLANALVFMVNAFLLPQIAPARTGAVQITLHRPDRVRGESFSERRVKDIVRGELQQLAAQRNPAAPSQLIRHHQPPELLMRGPSQGRPTTTSPVPNARELRRILMPFGVLREFGGGIGLYLTSLVTFVAISVGATLIMPSRLRAIRESMSVGRYGFLRLAAIGSVGYLLSFVLCLMLAATVVGLPIAIVILLAMAPLTVIGLAAVGLALGSRLRRLARVNSASPLYDLLIGLMVLFPGGLLPYLGWVIAGVSASLGFGAILITKMGNRNGWALSALEEE